MPNITWIGVFKNDQITGTGAINIGQSVLQPRQNTKQNRASYGIGDGLILQPIGINVNQDTDMIDNVSAGAPSINTSPQV